MSGKIIGVMLLTGFVAGLFLAGVQNPDGSCNLAVTLTCIAVAVTCALLWDRLFATKKTHIPDDVYDDLNEQIESYARLIQNDSKDVEFESSGVSVKVRLSAETSQYSFTDDAWGYPKTCIETDWYCSVELLEVRVSDENGREIRNHDFNPAYIENEYKSSHRE